MNKSELYICSKKKKKLETISKYWTKKVAKYAERSNDAPVMDSQNLEDHSCRLEDPQVVTNRSPPQEKEIRLVLYTYVC